MVTIFVGLIPTETLQHKRWVIMLIRDYNPFSVTDNVISYRNLKGDMLAYSTIEGIYLFEKVRLQWNKELKFIKKIRKDIKIS